MYTQVYLYRTYTYKLHGLDQDLLYMYICSSLASPNGHLQSCVEHLWSVALGQHRHCIHNRWLKHLDVQEGVNISAQLWTVGMGVAMQLQYTCMLTG